MQQAAHIVPGRYPLERLHDEMVAVNRQRRTLVDHGKLMLGRRHLIVLCLCRDSQPPQLLIDILHEGGYAGSQRPVIVIVKLLSLGRHRPEQSAAGIDQILALVEGRLVNQKVFLLRTDIGAHFLRVRIVKQTKKPQRLPVQHVHGTQERRFEIKRLPIVGTERGRNA